MQELKSNRHQRRPNRQRVFPAKQGSNMHRRRRRTKKKDVCNNHRETINIDRHRYFCIERNPLKGTNQQVSNVPTRKARLHSPIKHSGSKSTGYNPSIKSVGWIMGKLWLEEREREREKKIMWGGRTWRRLTKRPERRKSRPSGTTTAAAAIAMVGERRQQWEPIRMRAFACVWDKEREREREGDKEGRDEAGQRWIYRGIYNDQIINYKSFSFLYSLLSLFYQTKNIIMQNKIWNNKAKWL